MYPLGILFGLGFDTATEVGVLTISAVEGSKGMSLWDSSHLSSSLCRGDVARRCDGQHCDVGCLRMGLCETDPANSTTI